MLVAAMTYNLGIWLIKKKKLIFFTITKKYVIYAFNYRLNQSGQHNL